ncbi:hypothetical protein [Paenibacillus terrigena]|uniref:hypothetical protein n=1 Tax=Paenibacillus terrigena TaxID=369333 RepID=UPI0028D76A7C|nr:hypothetical protein [Paenibacillus terrigena]
MNDFIAQQYRRGRQLARGLTLLNLALILIVEILSLREGVYSNLIGSIVWIVICIGIYLGSVKAKWVFIVFTILNMLLFICGLLLGAISGPFSTSLFIFSIITLVCQLMTSILLLCSSSVNDFLYRQANG